MPFYENVFIARQDVSTTQVEALTEQFNTLIEANGGKVTKTEYWGVKTLAFRIKKNRKAHFTLLNVDAPHAAVAEVERLEAISEDVIRSLTVKQDGPLPAPRSGPVPQGASDAAALQTSHQNHGGWLSGEIKCVVGLAHQSDQFAMYHTHHGLAGREASDHLLPQRLFAHARNKVAYHRQRHVGLEQCHAHFAQRVADVVFGNARLAAQRLDDLG